MVQQLKIFLNFSIVFLLLFSSDILAQSNGIIRGNVVDSQTGEYLPGANVLLMGTNIGAATGKDGSFRMANVPPGNYSMIVRYVGYKADSTSLTVKGGSTVNINIKLTIGYVNLQDVVVEGLRQGQVKALALQKEANNIKDVVSREQISNYPDQNVAEVLQRVPGVYIERSEGDGRYVLIRGTDPRLSNVTVNGDPVATNRNQERYAQLDIIGSNQIAYLEVNKTLTPDMDANSIGGSVNIISRSPFDYPGTNFKLSANSGYSNLDSKPLWGGNFSYSTRFGENKGMGFSVNAYWDQKTRGQDQLEYSWNKSKDINKNVIPFALTELDLEDIQLTHKRYGVGGSYEFRPDENNKYYVKLMWSEFDDDFNRARTRLRIDKGDYLDPTGTLTQGSRVIREGKSHTEKQLQSDYSIGGENHFGDLTMDYNAAYSYGTGQEKPDVTSTWQLDSKVNLNLDLSNTLYPKWGITNLDPAAVNDAAQYSSPDFIYRDFNSSNSYTVGGINFTLPYSFLNFYSKLKAGFKYTHTYKDNGDTYWEYAWQGSNPLNMSQFLSSRNRTDFMGSNYSFGPETDYSSVKDFVQQNASNPSIFPGTESIWDALGQTYQVKENVAAYYLMTTINFGDLALLAGFRHEFVNDSQDGYNLVFDSKGNFSSISPTTGKLKYNNIFPMASLDYTLDKNTKIRLSVTRSTSRPNFWDLVPYFYIQDKKLAIKAGNPSLVPTYSTNADFSASYYFSGIGIASFDLFYKSLTDISYNHTTLLQNGIYAGYTEEQVINGGNASLYGFELNWQQELTFLPGFLSGFGIYANYCHTWAKADLVGREGFLPGQTGDIANLALAYEKGGFKARVSYQYQGKFITDVGINPDFDYFQAPHGQADFTASQKILSGVGVFLEVTNFNNALDRQYMGVSSRPINTELFSWYSRVGINYSL